MPVCNLGATRKWDGLDHCKSHKQCDGINETARKEITSHDRHRYGNCSQLPEVQLPPKEKLWPFCQIRDDWGCAKGAPLAYEVLKLRIKLSIMQHKRQQHQPGSCFRRELTRNTLLTAQCADHSSINKELCSKCIIINPHLLVHQCESPHRSRSLHNSQRTAAQVRNAVEAYPEIFLS